MILLNDVKLGEESKLYRDDFVVVKFVDFVIVGRFEVEDVCYYGLVEFIVNMKEVMNVINSMFREFIEFINVVRRLFRG